MLEIVQARDYKKYYKLFEQLNISDEIVSVVEAMNNDEIIGFGIYHYNLDKLVVDYIESNSDLELFDGITRTILFLALNNNINSALFNMKDRTNLIKLRFISENENSIANIANFMDNCKNCKNY